MGRARVAFLAALRAALLLSILAFGVALCASEAKAAVYVQFAHPQHYTDSTFCNAAGPLSAKIVMEEVRRELGQLGGRYLPPGQVLSVEILDIQLAGYNNWWSFPGNEIRIISNSAPPPRFKLRYTLRAKGKPLAASEETVTDINFLMNPIGRLSSDPLVYEKSLLDSWFKERFTRREPAK